jgi:hypothetical protein
VPDEVALDVLLLLLGHHTLLDPPHCLPALELHQDLVGVDGLDQVEEDVPLDCVAREVEWLVDLDEGGGHRQYRDIMLIITIGR